MQPETSSHRDRLQKRSEKLKRVKLLNKQSVVKIVQSGDERGSWVNMVSTKLWNLKVSETKCQADFSLYESVTWLQTSCCVLWALHNNELIKRWVQVEFTWYNMFLYFCFKCSLWGYKVLMTFKILDMCWIKNSVLWNNCVILVFHCININITTLCCLPTVVWSYFSVMFWVWSSCV